MKQYVIFTPTEKIRIEMQEKLFKAGFAWSTSGKTVINEDFYFLFINPRGYSGYLTQASDFQQAALLVKDGAIPLVHDFDPFELDGATKPEKMIEIDGKDYSESTIKKALQEYVK